MYLYNFFFLICLIFTLSPLFYQYFCLKTFLRCDCGRGARCCELEGRLDICTKSVVMADRRYCNFVPWKLPNWVCYTPFSIDHTDGQSSTVKFCTAPNVWTLPKYPNHRRRHNDKYQTNHPFEKEANLKFADKTQNLFVVFKVRRNMASILWTP